MPVPLPPLHLHGQGLKKHSQSTTVQNSVNGVCTHQPSTMS
jgi:hypothetical protein